MERKNDVNKTFVYCGSCPWKYYLFGLLNGESFEVTEEEFFSCVGYDRSLIPMHYDANNINRQNFYDGDTLIAYRVRVSR